MFFKVLYSLTETVERYCISTREIHYLVMDASYRFNRFLLRGENRVVMKYTSQYATVEYCIVKSVMYIALKSDYHKGMKRNGGTSMTYSMTLNDGNTIPAIGFGVFKIPADGSTYTAVKEALEVGYRHIDTAQAYFNEKEVGEAIKDSGVPREDIFITSKLWIQDFAYETAKRTIDTTLEKMGLEYLDLYLLHQPYGEVEQAWKALEEAKAEGKIKSIGVSNFTPTFWKQFVFNFKTIPAVNQVEFNPYFQQKELRALLEKDHVVLEAWAPLGQGRAELFEEPVLTALANKYGKDVGQIMLRFENQEGIVVLPKSTKRERMVSNKDIFDFEFTLEEMEAIRALDKEKGIHDPDAPGMGEYLLSAYDVHAHDE